MTQEDDSQNDDTLTREEKDSLRRDEKAKQLNMVVCICKGIKLGTVLAAMEGCETVADVNRKAGTGSGGCQGQRCGPRIKILLRKMHEKKGKT